MRRTRTAILTATLALGLVLAACATAADGPAVAAHAAHAATVSKAKNDRVEFRQAMRKLWEDHVTWTRLYIVSAVAGLDDRDDTAGRLLRNQDDIGNAIKPFYGDAAGAQLTALLREHILIAAGLIDGAKASDAPRVEKAKIDWYENADAISSFLSEANPKNWPFAAVRDHMRMHLDLTLDEALARLQGRFADDIAAYDKVHDAILELSDTLAAGIIKQFADRFTG